MAELRGTETAEYTGGGLGGRQVPHTAKKYGGRRPSPSYAFDLKAFWAPRPRSPREEALFLRAWWRRQTYRYSSVSFSFSVCPFLIYFFSLSEMADSGERGIKTQPSVRERVCIFFGGGAEPLGGGPPTCKQTKVVYVNIYI